MEANVTDNQKNDNYKNIKSNQAFYREMNLKENPIQILGEETSYKSENSFSGEKSIKSVKKKKKLYNDKKQRKVKKATNLNQASKKNLIVIDEEIKSGRKVYEDSFISEKREKNYKKINKEDFKNKIESLNNNDNNNNKILNENINKGYKEKFKKMLKFDDL